MTTFGHGMPHLPKGFGSAVVRGAGLVVAAFLCQSFFWSPANPLPLKIVVAGFVVLAACRPDVGLLVLAGIVPFGRLIPTLLFPSATVGMTEALVLAYMAGWFWNRLRRGTHDGPAPPGLSLGYLFAVVVAASLLVEIGIYRYWRDYWQPFLGWLLTYFARDYLNVVIESRPWVEGPGGLVAAPRAALLLESLGVMRAAYSLCQGKPVFARRLLWALAIAAVGTAILSVGASLQAAGTEGRSLLSVFQTDRVAIHITKVNTAASSFVLFLPVLIGLAAWSDPSSRRSLPKSMVRLTATATGAGLLLTALWMTGSRTAMVAGMVVTVGASVYAVTRGRLRRVTWRSAVAIVVACGIVAALLGLGFHMRTATLETHFATRGSFPVRLLMWRAALATLAARPIFGVGIGQFQYQVADFVPDVVLPAQVGVRYFNAHNQFLEVAAELGLVGGVLFVGMFGVILWRARRTFRTSHDPVLGGAMAGVVAFLITCLAGQPLLYGVVAFPFWMVVGVVLAAGYTAEPAASDDRKAASRRLKSRLITGFIVVLALSVPVRIWQGKEQVNLALANYGFSEWHESRYGRPYRLVRDVGTFFTYPHARGLRLPIRRDVEAGRNPLEVDVSLDGRVVHTLSLTDDEWQTVEIVIPADTKRRFRRLDLAVRAPADVTAQIRVARAEISHDPAVEPGRAR